MGVPLEVNYSNVVVPIKKDFSDVPRQLTTKRLYWTYEKEWRLVGRLQDAREVKCDNKTFYTLPAEREMIAHVVFGDNASEVFIGRITTGSQGSKAIIQKLKIDPVSHDLVLSEIGRGS
jgi:hypothetical protein